MELSSTEQQSFHTKTCNYKTNNKNSNQATANRAHGVILQGALKASNLMYV